MAKILIVEDDAYTCEYLSYWLGKDHHITTALRTADEVLGCLASLADYDAMILDIMMLRGKELASVPGDKGETGEILFEKIRARRPEMQVVVLSAREGEYLRDRFGGQPDVHVIEKPLNETNVAEIRAIFGRAL
jgi:CheY-like chemotaxis protein